MFLLKNLNSDGAPTLICLTCEPKLQQQCKGLNCI